MESLSFILMIAGIALVCILLVRLLTKPIKLVFKLLINAGLGFIILFIVNFFGGFFDFSLGGSFINALVAGVLGVPGVIILIVLKLLG